MDRSTPERRRRRSRVTLFFWILVAVISLPCLCTAIYLRNFADEGILVVARNSGGPCLLIGVGQQSISFAVVGAWPIKQFRFTPVNLGGRLGPPVQFIGDALGHQWTDSWKELFTFVPTFRGKVQIWVDSEGVPLLHDPGPVSESSVHVESPPLPQWYAVSPITSYAGVEIPTVAVKWPAALSFIVSVGLLLRRRWRSVREGRRRSRNQCLRCGYDLRASPKQCPECGALRESAP